MDTSPLDANAQPQQQDGTERSVDVGPIRQHSDSLTTHAVAAGLAHQSHGVHHGSRSETAQMPTDGEGIPQFYGDDDDDEDRTYASPSPTTTATTTAPTNRFSFSSHAATTQASTVRCDLSVSHDVLQPGAHSLGQESGGGGGGGGDFADPTRRRPSFAQLQQHQTTGSPSMHPAAAGLPPVLRADMQPGSWEGHGLLLPSHGLASGRAPYDPDNSSSSQMYNNSSGGGGGGSIHRQYSGTTTVEDEGGQPTLLACGSGKARNRTGAPHAGQDAHWGGDAHGGGGKAKVPNLAGGNGGDADGDVLALRAHLLRRKTLPSILLDSWEFRKLAPEGSVLPNALVCLDVDDDGVEECVVGTTEGLLLVVKPDCRAPIFTHSLSATISVVLYSVPHRRLVLVTLEGQCEVLDDFLVVSHEAGGGRDNSANPPLGAGKDSTTTTTTTPVAAAAAPPLATSHVNLAVDNTTGHGLVDGEKRAIKPRSVFLVPSNCVCGDIGQAEDGTDRVFLGSFDRRMYVYSITGACLVSIFMHSPISSIRTVLWTGDMWAPTAQEAQLQRRQRPSAKPGTRPPTVAAASNTTTTTTTAMPTPSIPMVFVATTTSLSMLRASSQDLQHLAQLEARRKQPLTLADGDAIRLYQQSLRSLQQRASANGHGHGNSSHSNHHHHHGDHRNQQQQQQQGGPSDQPSSPGGRTDTTAYMSATPPTGPTQFSPLYGTGSHSYNSATLHTGAHHPHKHTHTHHHRQQQPSEPSLYVSPATPWTHIATMAAAAAVTSRSGGGGMGARVVSHGTFAEVSYEDDTDEPWSPAGNNDSGRMSSAIGGRGGEGTTDNSTTVSPTTMSPGGGGGKRNDRASDPSLPMTLVRPLWLLKVTDTGLVAPRPVPPSSSSQQQQQRSGSGSGSGAVPATPSTKPDGTAAAAAAVGESTRGSATAGGRRGSQSSGGRTRHPSDFTAYLSEDASASRSSFASAATTTSSSSSSSSSSPRTGSSSSENGYRSRSVPTSSRPKPRAAAAAAVGPNGSPVEPQGPLFEESVPRHLLLPDGARQVSLAMLAKQQRSEEALDEQQCSANSAGGGRLAGQQQQQGGVPLGVTVPSQRLGRRGGGGSGSSHSATRPSYTLSLPNIGEYDAVRGASNSNTNNASAAHDPPQPQQQQQNKAVVEAREEEPLSDSAPLPLSIDVSTGQHRMLLIVSSEDARAFVLSFSAVQLSAMMRRTRSRSGGDPAEVARVRAKLARRRRKQQLHDIHIFRCGHGLTALDAPASATAATTGGGGGAKLQRLTNRGRGSTGYYNIYVPVKDAGRSSRPSPPPLLRQTSSALGEEGGMSPLSPPPETDFAIRVECCWAGQLTRSPLIQRARILRVAEDGFCAVLVSATGTCFAVDPDTCCAVEYAVLADCSSFTLTVGPPVPVTPSREHRSTPSTATNTPMIGAGDANTRKQKQRQQQQQRPAKTVLGRAVSCVCVCVDEMSVYSIGDAFITTVYQARGSSSGKASRRTSDTTTDTTTTCSRHCSRGRRRRSRSTKGIAAAAAMAEQAATATSLSPFVLVDGWNEAEREEERRVLLHLGAELMLRDGVLTQRQRRLAHATATTVSSGGEAESEARPLEAQGEEEEEQIFYARRVIAEGYSADEWAALARLDAAGQTA